MSEHVHGGDGYYRRKLFWIGVIALFVIFGGLWLADRKGKDV